MKYSWDKNKEVQNKWSNKLMLIDGNIYTLYQFDPYCKYNSNKNSSRAGHGGVHLYSQNFGKLKQEGHKLQPSSGQLNDLVMPYIKINIWKKARDVGSANALESIPSIEKHLDGLFFFFFGQNWCYENTEENIKNNQKLKKKNVWGCQNLLKSYNNYYKLVLSKDIKTGQWMRRSRNRPPNIRTCDFWEKRHWTLVVEHSAS